MWNVSVYLFRLCCILMIINNNNNKKKDPGYIKTEVVNVLQTDYLCLLAISSQVVSDITAVTH